MSRSRSVEKAGRRTPRRARSVHWRISRLLTATLGGAISAISWLPPHRPEILVLGLAAVLLAVRSSRQGREALLTGFSGALVFFAIVTRPLVSAHVWSGWTGDESSTGDSPEWWLLNLLWVLLSVWGSLFWAATLAFYRRLRTESTWMRVLGIATVWAGVAEWLRSITAWGFEWGFLGIAVVDIPALRNWSSVGGVFLLSSLVVGASALLVELVVAIAKRTPVVVGGIVVVVALVWLLGTVLGPGAEGSEADGIEVAAFQFAPPVPPAGTTPLGVSPKWFSALRQAIEREYRLIVLPESISSQAVELDGIAAASLGPRRQVPADRWQQALTPLLHGSGTFLAVGVEGVEGGVTHNSTTVWNESGLVGWQHKVSLVPFAEYQPRGWGFLDARSLTHYRPGESLRPIDAGPFRIGSFICQEVQYSGVTRELVRRGANVLISGGNDGVFADRRVAEVHHSMARIRAAEVRRYLVRAMKSGVTSIIDPRGEVVGQAPGTGSALVANTAFLSTSQTFWTRFGTWPLLLGTIGFLSLLLRDLGRGG